MINHTTTTLVHLLLVQLLLLHLRLIDFDDDPKQELSRWRKTSLQQIKKGLKDYIRAKLVEFYSLVLIII
jgi:hypothetical protein